MKIVSTQINEQWLEANEKWLVAKLCEPALSLPCKREYLRLLMYVSALHQSEHNDFRGAMATLVAAHARGKAHEPVQPPHPKPPRPRPQNPTCAQCGKGYTACRCDRFHVAR